MIVEDAKKAHLLAAAGRVLFVEIPVEVGEAMHECCDLCMGPETLRRSGKRTPPPSSRLLASFEAKPMRAFIAVADAGCDVWSVGATSR